MQSSEIFIAEVTVQVGNYELASVINYDTETEEHMVDIKAEIGGEAIDEIHREQRFIANGAAEAIREGMKLTGEMICDFIKNATIEPFAETMATRGIHDDEEYTEKLEWKVREIKADIVRLLPGLESLQAMPNLQDQDKKTLNRTINTLAILTSSEDGDLPRPNENGGIDGILDNA